MNTSSYERKIITILQKSDVSFKREKTFRGLNSSSGTPLRFDFYIEDRARRICLEIDGAQHFQQSFGTGRRGLMKQQTNDQKKNSYCLMHDIALYRIPYWDIDGINSFSDLIQEKYRVRTKYHNLYVEKK